jgi:hypothetical protein
MGKQHTKRPRQLGLDRTGDRRSADGANPLGRPTSLRRVVPSRGRGSEFQPLRAAFDSTTIDQDLLQSPLGNDRVDVSSIGLGIIFMAASMFTLPPLRFR